jgi:hypothetical protein
MAPLPIGSFMAMSLAYAMRLWFLTTLFLNSGVLVSGVVREGHWPFKAIEKEGLQEGKHDNNEAGRPRHIHDPGSQQEPRNQSHPLFQAQPQRAFTVGLTVGDNAAHPIESQGQALLNGHGGLSAVTGIAIAYTQAEWEALTVHAETQEHLLEIIMSIFAMPISRTRWDWPLTPVGLLLIRPIEGDRRRILV